MAKASKQAAARRRAVGRRSLRNKVDPAVEAAAWASVKDTAEASYQFWKQFLVLRRGPNSTDPLRVADDTEFLYVIRSVSWVESQHGTGAGLSAGRDPIQCGNPKDVWWREISGQVTSKDRFVCGPGASNYYADELPDAVSSDPSWNGAASISQLTDTRAGHGTASDDNGFTSTISYWWGVPYLIWCINTKSGKRPTFKCAEVLRDSLIVGAVEYNGQHDPLYKDKLLEAYSLFAPTDTLRLPSIRRGSKARDAGLNRHLRTLADSSPIAAQIAAQCALAFAANSEDCNKFAKAVASVFFDPPLFTGPTMDADRIIEEMEGSHDWTALGTSHAKAIASAQAGQFVVAGMTAEELHSDHGHLAIVVGDDGKPSGNVIVPICYAGSLRSAARVQRARVSETFPAQAARTNKIGYFARDVQLLPKASAVSRLLDHLRGHIIADPTEFERLGNMTPS